MTPTKITIRKIERVTGLKYCDHNCPCGENNHLMWIPSSQSVSEWIEWANGVSPADVYGWMLTENKNIPELRANMIAERMRLT